MITYFTDTDCDVTSEIAAKYGYKLISMPYSLNDTTVYPYVDFDEFDDKTFYQTLREIPKEKLPTTSALTKEKYIEYFEPEFAKGNDIFYVHFSAKMTATFGFMKLALDELEKKYPERKFYEVDTKGITIAAYNIACEIGEMILAGKTPDDILLWAETEVDKFATYFYANDLKFFRKSGRVGNLAAIMGSIIGIRPIITMDSNGVMTNIGKVRGKETAISKLISYVEELGEDIKDHKIIIGHCDSVHDALRIKEGLMEKFGELDNIEIIPVNPTAGSHCGPDTLGVCFHAKHR
ncbi:MAG: DegV family protein [Clostridia bacterium]|nr:DegV family protein [Clostridia bacterium]